MTSYLKQQLPLYGFIEPTTKCNASCEMCERTFIKRKTGDMSLERFIYIINQIPTLKEVALQGLGEPLLNPYLFEMCRYLKDKKIRVSFNTNGSLLDDKNIRKIFDIGVDEIRISYDSITKNNFEYMRKGLNFNIITKNIIKIANYKKMLRGSETKLALTIVSMRKNFHEIPQIVDFAIKYSFDKIELLNLYIMNVGIATFHNSLLSINSEKVRSMINLIVKKCKKSNTECLVPILDYDKTYKQVLNCKWPFNGINITWEGYVTPCCVITNPAILNFGNVFETPLDIIWNSKKYERFRNMFINNRIPYECKPCLESRHILKHFLEVDRNG